MTRDEIERLLALAEEQRNELMGISTAASASGSDPEDVGSIPASPTSDDGPLG